MTKYPIARLTVAMIFLMLFSLEVTAGESGEEVVDEAAAMAAEGHAAMLDETLFPSASQCAVCGVSSADI